MTNRYRHTAYISITSAEGYEFIVDGTSYYVEDAIEVKFDWDKADRLAEDIEIVDAHGVFIEDADDSLYGEEWEKVKEAVLGAIIEEFDKGKSLYTKVVDGIYDDIDTPEV